MSRARPRSPEARQIIEEAQTLGYVAVGATAKGHLKFRHKGNGALVVTFSRASARGAENARAQLKRSAAH